MRLKGAAIEAFLARPAPEICCALIYGPDQGQVAERARRLARQIVDDLADPFRVSELDGESLREAPGRLAEEAQALCLTGGRRLVRVRDASDGTTAALKPLLAQPAIAGFVVLEGGDLGGGSSLRRLVEGDPRSAALPCYRTEERDLNALVRSTLSAEGLSVDADAMSWLIDHLGDDLLQTRTELDKLVLYMGESPSRRVTLPDAAAVIGDASALGLDDVVDAVLLRDRRRLDVELDRLLASGEAPMRILRVCASTLLRLLRLRVEMGNGLSAAAAVDAARPPVHFRRKPVLVGGLQRWTGDQIVAALGRLQEAELASKRARAPDALLCRRVLHDIAAA